MWKLYSRVFIFFRSLVGDILYVVYFCGLWSENHSHTIKYHLSIWWWIFIIMSFILYIVACCRPFGNRSICGVKREGMVKFEINDFHNFIHILYDVAKLLASKLVYFIWITKKYVESTFFFFHPFSFIFLDWR